MLRVLLVGVLFFSSLFATQLQAKSIVVLGDSISASYRFDMQQGWVALLRNKLAVSHPEYKVHNASISGDTTAGGLARLPNLLTHYQPTIVILELGANDGLRGMSLKAMKDNLSAMIQQVQQSGAKVLLLSMRIPSNYGNRYINQFYDNYQQVATQHNTAVVPFILKGVALKKSLMQADGIHPNAKAQPIIIERIFPYLLPLL